MNLKNTQYYSFVSTDREKDATQNVEKDTIGKVKDFDYPIENHGELAERLGIADFTTSAETSGNGFYYLKGDLAFAKPGIDQLRERFHGH